MQGGFYSSVGGMVTQINRLDVIANNIANANTTGFKRDDVVIGDFMRLYEQHKEFLPIEDQTKDAAKFYNRSLNRVPQIVEEFTDRSAGGVVQTENTFDFALSRENAYFMIETPEGIRFSRDGSFVLNEEGRLVNKEGYAVLPREYIESPQYIDFVDGFQVEVDSDGNIYNRSLTNEELDEALLGGNIAVVSFENPKFLQKVGDNLYKYPEERMNEMEVLERSGAVRQGFLEKSNINVVYEMTGLIETNRLVEAYSKVLKTHMDDLNTEAITRLAARA
ncbi:flagellar hook-basal body protein [Helicobacter pullorum]|uniref:Flagellar basal body rod protein FlgG n=2 Tax=Helicobacter pullorum TaxID=35818 RepID=A0A1C0W0L7_9HELI|nr:flagellar hook-basal body protein [Helicobacter pullorum]HIS09133.1 flagellar hook-basal body protein [Candidatus Scatomorpha intestinipullorum]EEQ63620.1 flagellar hook-basal body protein [Helicobacter pullorum MIT 98-5489]KAB0575297.1 flagellar hook-basal body protein [Helicobacter pullorum NCTC 12824]KPH50376.1 flagellar basal body rod protein FlgG [Helicobacter pullorum]KPH52086.1 flagellar basal body rod protein FlgG [Helicobacter pullorum]